MNIRLKALMYSMAILLCSAMAGLFTVQILSMIPVPWWPWIAIAFFIAMCLYVLYNIILNQLQYRNQLQIMVDQK